MRKKESGHNCIIRRCEGALLIESFHSQDGTKSTAKKVVCDKNSSHCYFLVDGRGPSKYNRMYHK